MKAFLLAAGHGTRLRPFTDSAPKCLLPVRGLPMLSIWFTLCRRHGITDVLVNTHAHSAAVVDFVRRRRDGLRVEVVEEPELYGSAGTLRRNREWVESEEAFWILYADVLTSADLSAMSARHSPRFAATLGLYSVNDPERCGIAKIDEQGIVSAFEEKPARPSGNLAFAGVMIGTQQLLDAIPASKCSDIGFDVLPRLVGKMRGHYFSEYILDIGTRQNYELAQNTWPGLERVAGAVLP